MEVTLIQAPQFKINFKQFSRTEAEQRELSTAQLISNIAQGIIRFVGVVLMSAMNGALLTLKHAYSSFSRLILDTLKITDFYLGAFKIAYWAFTLGFTFISSTGRAVFQAYSHSKELYLSQFLPVGVNPVHIQTKEINLETSGVPREIKVENLLAHFDEIDFNEASSPFHMSLGEHTKEKLKKGLEQFVQRVIGREAFLGTPPAHDTVRLEAFYQQIENALRLSLHKLATKLEDFKNRYPDYGTTEDPAVKGEYRGLLEDRSRMVMDLAIAGDYCGARYMGETMEAYFHICGEGEVSGTLEEVIFQTLAEKRLKIAKAQIQTHYGTDSHAYSKYMQNMGALLAIPGTENIIEHLSQSFNVQEAVQRFFEEYDEACIIETIQEKLRSSQPFRELVIDWLKEQRGTWAALKDKSLDTLILEFTEVIESVGSIAPDLAKNMEVIGKIFQIDQGSEGYPSRDEFTWDEFVDDLVVLPRAKAILSEEFSTLNLMDRMRKRSEIISVLKYGITGEIFRERYRERQPLQAMTPREMAFHDKICRMRRILPIGESVLQRVLTRKTELRTAVMNFQALEDDVQFLQALKTGDLKEQGLYPLLMEWILDAHHVFFPQSLVAQPHLVEVQEDKKGQFRAEIDPDGYAWQLKRADTIDVEGVLPVLESDFESTSSPRYLFGADTDVERICNQIFERAFKDCREAVIAHAYSATGKSAYSKLRKAILIDAAAQGAKIIGHPLLKVAVSAYILYRLIQFGRIAYEKTTIMADKAHRFIMKEASPPIRRGYKTAMQIHRWVQSNKWKIMIYSYVLQTTMRRIPHPISRQLANRIAPTSIFGAGDSYVGIMIGLAYSVVTFGWNALSRISSTFKNVSDRETQERLALEKQHAFAVWNSVISSR